ncbi:hypothetical protein SH2C18_01100 [Clostridium sediminicola]|uniref:zinc dependent phospholipase C family protein n=1 Tax=Clostridium sediminicola TaxID=3114879 RepID=UPI0031F20094
MSDVIAHILCGEKTLEKINNTTFKTEIAKHPLLLNIGCQGPDIFLYYKVWPWVKKDEFNSLGNLLHNKKTGDFLYLSAMYLTQQENSDEFFQLFTYIMGLICHYNLDRFTHPFIYYFSGISDGSKETKKYSNYHKQFEIILDSFILKKYKGKLSSKEKIHNLVKYDINNKLPGIIPSYYKKTIKDVYNIEISSSIIDTSVKDMYKVLKLLHDPFCIKKITLKTFACITKKDLIYSYAIYPHKINYDKDYLNLNHKKWSHPCSLTEWSRDSFLDLFQSAVDASASMINDLVDYIISKDEEISLKLKNHFRNVSYNTNKQNSPEIQLKYFDCIFEEKNK